MVVPNNVGLEAKKLLASQLDSYQDRFRAWWGRSGPAEFLDRRMHLRCPTGSTERGRWAEFCSIAPADYQWGIFQVPAKQSTIEFGRHKGAKLWDHPPDDAYHLLLCHIVIQADAENGSVEQCRSLTQSAPSLHDLENLFQFFLEEGRHSWAMVHLLLEHFGEDGVVESEELLERMCGGASRPRLLNSFNYMTEDWLAHFLWCFLADRDARHQLTAVSRSAFKPLRETANYMIFEEPRHIWFGLQGLERTIARSALVTRQRDRLDIFADGAIPLPVIQRYMNFWMPAVYDLFGNDQSSDASEMYERGIRVPAGFSAWRQADILIDACDNDRVWQAAVSPERAVNAVMRRQFIAEITRTVEQWNNWLTRANIDYRLKVPHERFNRKVGPLKGAHFDPDGNLLLGGGAHTVAQYLPTASDLSQVRALMVRVLDPDRCASWIAPPSSGLRRFVYEVEGR